VTEREREREREKGLGGGDGQRGNDGAASRAGTRDAESAIRRAARLETTHPFLIRRRRRYWVYVHSRILLRRCVRNVPN